MTNYLQSPLAVALVAITAVLIAAIVLIVSLWRRYERLLQEHERLVQEARKESVAQSRSTLKGQIAEQMAPLLPGFAYQPADSRFLGNPIDYVVFSGYTAFADLGASGDELEIILLEVKQGSAQLSSVQRAIGRAVEEGRIRFEITRVAEDGSVTTKEWHPNRRKRVSDQHAEATGENST